MSLKYLPKFPSEFVFIAKFSEKDKEEICPNLKTKLESLKEERSSLYKEESRIKKLLTEGMDITRKDALMRKIRRGKNLNELEQELKTVSEKISTLNRQINFANSTLIGDKFCEE